jgi:hypothetical protein
VRLEGAGRGERGEWVRVGRGRLPGRHHRVRDMPGTRLRTAVCFHPAKVSLTGSEDEVVLLYTGIAYDHCK